MSGDKWQSKTLFLSIFDLCSTIELTFSIAAYPVWAWSGSKLFDTLLLLLLLLLLLMKILHILYFLTRGLRWPLNRFPEFVDVVIRIVWVYAWRPKQHFLIMSGCSLGWVSPYTKQVIKCLALDHTTVPLWMLNQRPDNLNIRWRGSSVI